METMTHVQASALVHNQFYELVMENNPNYVFVKDEEGVILYANKAFLSLYAPELRDQIIGRSDIGHFPPEQVEVFRQEDRKAFVLGKTEIIEVINDYLGNAHTLLSKKIRFEDQNGKARMLGISADISELAQRERALVQSNTMLENFAALAAHDLRSPLSTFVSFLQLIQLDKGNQLSTKSEEYLKLILQSAQHLTQHVSGLLSAYKASHSGKVESADADLNMLLEEVRFNLSTLIESSEARVFSNRLPQLNVNADLFRHLLHNLIENSIKYRSHEKPVIMIKCEMMEEEAFFSFEDNGLGIEPEQETKIFQLYQQGTGQGLAGFGIGLSLCKKIVELHKGRIWIDRSYTQGCRICLTIPQQQDAAAIGRHDAVRMETA